MTTKPKRGRPQSGARLALAQMRHYSPEGGLRTKINWMHQLEFMRLVSGSSVEIQRAILGCAVAEVADFPKGWKTAAAEIGRFVSLVDPSEHEEIVNVVVEARNDGFSWSEIAAHFRKLRLGERPGNIESLVKALLRTATEYQQRFPKMSPDSLASAAQQFCDQILNWSVDADSNDPT